MPVNQDTVIDGCDHDLISWAISSPHYSRYEEKWRRT
jgi:hypothetical protein